MQVLGVEDVKSALRALHLGIDVIEFNSPTATAQQAAENIGCELGQIVKSLGFMINRMTPALVLSSGDQTIDERKVAALFAVGRKKARLMTAEQCIAQLGYPPGAVPPIAHRCDDLPVYIDATLRRFETGLCRGRRCQRHLPD